MTHRTRDILSRLAREDAENREKLASPGRALGLHCARTRR
jgi:hypothetical protein